MAKKIIRGAAAALCAAAFIAVGCTGGSSISPANVSGTWNGSLTLSYSGGGSTSGSLNLSLGQQGDFASGTFTWVPTETVRSVTAQIDGDAVTLELHFTCAETAGNPVPTSIQTTAITGAFSGSTLSFSGVSGFACPAGGAESAVSAVSGSVSRTSNTIPL